MGAHPAGGTVVYGAPFLAPAGGACGVREDDPPTPGSSQPPPPRPSRGLDSSPASVPHAVRPARLLDQVRAALRTRHYSRRTEEAYVAWIRRFILFHGKRHPVQMGEPEISQYLTALAVRRRVSASTQNQALAALLFLYGEVLRRDLDWLRDVVRARVPKRLPVVLSREEVAAVMGDLRDVPRLMVMLLYGAGLRLLECCRLRVKDVDQPSRQIVVRSGKGDKDRVTLLPESASAPLERHLAAVRRLHQRDQARGAGWVELPGALARKYPNAGREWGWQWVFPATRTYVSRESGETRRHHLHESVVQRAVREAVLRAGIAKPASCHTFRHSFATHLLQGVAFLPCHLERTEASSGRLSKAA